MGEIARAAAIFEVDEIVVYDDLSVSRKGHGGVLDDGPSTNNGSSSSGNDRNNPNVFMARLLQVWAILNRRGGSHEFIPGVILKMLVGIILHRSHPSYRYTENNMVKMLCSLLIMVIPNPLFCPP